MVASPRFAAVVVLLAISNLARADEPAGAAIYMKTCARCHGAKGEGTKEYEHPLVGNRTLPQLSKYIAGVAQMPEDKPGTCVGPDADKVAA